MLVYIPTFLDRIFCVNNNTSAWLVFFIRTRTMCNVSQCRPAKLLARQQNCGGHIQSLQIEI